MMRNLLLFALLVQTPWLFAKAPTVEMVEVSLYTGVPGIARLGETFQSVTYKKTLKFETNEIEKESDLGKLGFTKFLLVKSRGARIYFKRDGVAMITIQEPFKGKIKGKKVALFTFSTPPVTNWESHLLKELGTPDARASGGRFGSEGLFYSWGDLSYNRMGPNELALYRNPELTEYRLKNFGRQLQLFPEK